MLKYVLVVFATGFLVSACGPRAKAPADSKAVPATDLEGKVKTLDVLSSPALGDVDFSSQAGCENKTASGHKIIDPRLRVGTRILREKQESGSGLNITYYEDCKVTDVASASVTVLEKTTLNKSKTIRTKACQVDTEASPSLSCLRDGEAAKPKTSSTTVGRTIGNCAVKYNNDPAQSVVANAIYNIDKVTQVKGKKVSITHNGTLLCNEKDLGAAKEVEVKLYTFDLPSIESDSCAASVVFHKWEIQDPTGKVLYSRTSGMTFFQK
jgi:hypothetical protein